MYRDYILLVDSGRPRRGNTAGRYRVSAKNKKQAVELLRNTIGFGKIQVYITTEENTLPPKAVVREVWVDGNHQFAYTQPRHSLDPFQP